MLRNLKWLAGAQQKGVHGKHLLALMALAALIAWPLTAQAVPVPDWHNTLDSTAAATIDGGTEEGDTPSYPAGVQGNMFQSNANGDSWLNWGTTEVQTIFGGWNDADGLTVDLYFTGIDGSTHSGNSGLWSVGHRENDNFMLLGVLNDQVRVNFRNDTGTSAGDSFAFTTANLNLISTETYHLTVRQHSSLAAVEVYLDDLGGNVYDNAAPIATGEPFLGYVFNFPLEAGNGPALAMSIGNRHPFGSAGNALNNGEAIDEVRIYNGSYTPADLIPEPASVWLMAVAFLPLLNRRRRA